jgi:hypothetical protein
MWKVVAWGEAGCMDHPFAGISGMTQAQALEFASRSHQQRFGIEVSALLGARRPTSMED